jgi:ABC-type multidrug transport system fused ATPase/permease subunit
MDGRTSITIAHRLSTIKDADHIFVFKNGDIVENGSHDQLLNEGGTYFKLWNASVK